MAKKFKYNIDYLYKSYKKYYGKGKMERAEVYNSIAQKLHGVDLDIIYHNKLNQEEQNKGPFGLGKYKKIKYG